jgi:HAD superfamily hydrolase (TIGR01509 family)
MALYAGPPKGVILDIDGTLLDSNGAHARAWAEALQGEGFALPYAMLRRQIGKGGDHVLWDLIGVTADSVLGQTISRNRGRIFKARYIADLAPFPKTRQLLLKMRSCGMSLHVATSSTAEEVGDLLTAAGISDLVGRVTTKDDAPRSKPAPDIVTAAVDKSGLSRERLLMLGDTPYDVEAARSAGVEIVGLTSGGWAEPDLVGALRVYRDTADILSRWDTSPFAASPLGALARVGS